MTARCPLGALASAAVVLGIPATAAAGAVGAGWLLGKRGEDAEPSADDRARQRVQPAVAADDAEQALDELDD